jgi:hypothetical protein
MTVDKEQAISGLVEVYPELQNTIRNLRDDWSPEEPPITVLMAELGVALAAGAGDLDDEAIRRITNTIELLLCAGTKSVKDAIATGLLEALVTASETLPCGPRLLSSLGPESKNYCRYWDKLTGRTTPWI